MENDNIEDIELMALSQTPAKPFSFSDLAEAEEESDEDSWEEGFEIDTEEEYRSAIPKISAKLFKAAMGSSDPKVFVPIFTALGKMFPDVKGDQTKQLDIATILSIMTEEQLAKLEEMSR
jgi:hypothetical protein